jgi:hypothetical protein
VPKRLIEFNGVLFQAIEGAPYLYDYYYIFDQINDGKVNATEHYRTLCAEDLFFLTFFVLKIPCANHPFWIQACRDVNEGPKDRTLDLWGREHGKSTIITIGETIQKCLKSDGACEERCCILSYNKTTAEAFLRSIKSVFEQSSFLKAVYPDILYQKPESESPQWSVETGIVLKRKGFYKEATVEAWGLVDGQPTGRHYTHRVYDDIVTPDLIRTPERLQTVSNAFDISQNLGAEGGTCRVVGTTYHYDDTLCYLKSQKDPIAGGAVWYVREKPSVEPRSFSGKPVFLSEARINLFKMNRLNFASQHLLDPQPAELQKLNPNMLIEMDQTLFPPRLYQFLIIDPAGRKPGKDSWAIGLLGVHPFKDDIGASDVYIKELIVEPMDYQRAMNLIVQMYIRAGRVAKVAIENPANASWDIHLINALKAKGKFVSVEAGTLVLLTHGGRSKDFRIESSLVWPLNNGKIHISTSVPAATREKLKEEMQRFPYWHDDGIDMCAYLYDLIKDYRFPSVEAAGRRIPDRWDRARERQRRAQRENISDKWLYA